MKATHIVLAVVAILVIFIFIGWLRLPNMVANTLAKKLQVSVEIDDISIGSSQIGIEKIDVGNPAGYTLPRAFAADAITVHAPLLHYFDQNVVIEEVSLDKVYLGLEFTTQGSKEGNWSEILKSYNRATGDTKKQGSDEDKSVLIKKLVLTNISVDLAYRDTGKVQQLKPIDRIEFTNVTSEGGIPTDQITSLIIKHMLNSIFSKEGIQNMVEGILELPQKEIETLLQPFKGLAP